MDLQLSNDVPVLMERRHTFIKPRAGVCGRRRKCCTSHTNVPSLSAL